MTILNRAFNLGVLAVSMLMFTGCGIHTRGLIVAQYTKYSPKEAAELTEEDEKFVEANCKFGWPKKSERWRQGPTLYIAREGYVLEHSSIMKVPLWVCEHVTKDQITGSADRINSKFQPDPALPQGQRSELRDYKGTGYDRGHQAPAGDQKRSQRLMDETFYLSNMAPQKGPFNRNVWRALEDQSRIWAKNCGDVYIITGGFMYDPHEEDEATADGLVEFEQIGPDSVAVPTYFFKIVLANRGGTDWEAVAFVLENRSYPEPFDFAKYRKTIDWIEQRTGLNFFPDLDPAEEERLESKLSDKSIWFE